MESQSTTNGASNAADFQPPTGNPQEVQGGLFQQGSGLQTPQTQDVLQQKSTIHVPVNPAPAPTITEAKPQHGVFIVLAVVIAIVLLSLHLWRKRTVFLTHSPEAPTPGTETAAPVGTQAKKLSSAQTSKKAAPASKAKKPLKHRPKKKSRKNR